MRELLRRIVSGIMLTLFLVSMFSTASSTIELVSTTELAYDDGTSEVGPAWNVAGGMFAVQFTAPFYPVKILEARIFFHALNNPSDPIRIHILDNEFHDLTEPIELTVYQSEAQTWLSVDVSSRNILVLSGDFLIASEQLVAGDPDIGSDTSSSPQGRSWEFNKVSWSPQPGTNYMIRALIGPPPPPPVGELQIPWIWLTTIILSIVATINFVKKTKKKKYLKTANKVSGF